MDSLNTALTYIVLLMLGIALFGASFLVLKEIRDDRIPPPLSTEIKVALQRSLNYGNQIIDVQPTVLQASKGTYQSIGVGIRNEVHNDTTFYEMVRCESAIRHNGSLLCNEYLSKSCADCTSWLSYLISHPIPFNRIEISALVLSIPDDATPGIYSYAIKICLDPQCQDVYDTQRWLRVYVV